MPRNRTQTQTAILERETERDRLIVEINELNAVADWTDEQRSRSEALQGELTECRSRLAALRAEMAADLEAHPPEEETRDAETRERDRLRAETRAADYLVAASEMRAVRGAARDFNAAIGIPEHMMPLELLAPPEERTETGIDPETRPVGSWLDRLVAGTAAAELGVTFRSATMGVGSLPATSAGATVAQRARDEAAAAAAWTTKADEAKPKRGTVTYSFTIEDDLRLGGELEMALVRDSRLTMMEGQDRAIFLGDAGADGTDADIVGLVGVTGIASAEIAQSAKVNGPGVATAFAGLIDGIHAMTPADLRIVASVASNAYWISQKSASGNAADQSIRQYLAANDLMIRSVRAGLEDVGATETPADQTAANDRAALVGRGRGIEGAAVAVIWPAVSIIRDPYTDARSGGIRLTMSYLWDFVVPRPANFALITYGS